MDESAGFLLSKWYLDCVAEDGAAFIGYAAALRWKVLSLHYSSILVRSRGGDIQTETSLTREALPQRVGSNINWTSRALHLEADWIGRSRPAERKLYSTSDGEIQWSCLLPMADALVNIRKLPTIRGLGYVEHMTMNVVPWRLPIKELRWGRFLNGNDALVWIDWQGAMPKTILFHNGAEVDAPRISDDELSGAGELHLSLIKKDILRSGPLLSTTLSKIPGINGLFPDAILQMHECKWLSKGELLMRNQSRPSGWALHELVTFP